MSLFCKPKTCNNCKHFNEITRVYTIPIGLCSHATVTSGIFKGDFIFNSTTVNGTVIHDQIKVAGNFGCIRFERKHNK